MWINATIEDLKGLYLFKDLDKEEIEKIAEFTKLKSYSPKDIIYYENDIKKQLFYLKSGHVKVY
ncbi:MAG TPA: cyclic nucleotide-binding domain-containing protein, partial [Campylobacterales bacterium]|nr:cyclic nucleotide-binding domain-containing protein [Campylobacterales bacterium]